MQTFIKVNNKKMHVTPSDHLMHTNDEKTEELFEFTIHRAINENILGK